MTQYLASVVGDDVFIVAYDHVNGITGWTCSGDSIIFGCDKPHVYPPTNRLTVEQQLAVAGGAATKHLELHGAVLDN